MTEKLSVVIQPEGFVFKMTPIGYHRFAQEYLSIVKIPEKETPLKH